MNFKNIYKKETGLDQYNTIDCKYNQLYVIWLENKLKEAITVTRCSTQLKDKEVKCFDDFLELYCEQKENNKWLYRDSVWSYDYIIQTYKELYKTL